MNGMVKTLFAAASLAAACTGRSEFSAGFARTAINPPLGSNIPGYFEDRRVEGVLDDIEANAIAISDGTNSAVLVSLDLVEIKGLSTSYRNRIASGTGLRPEAVYLACTHTHTGGNVGKDADSYEICFDSDSAYDEEVGEKLVKVCRAALADMKPAAIRIGRTECPGISFIRRYRMKDGSSRTNPGVNCPDVVAPIGDADDEVQIVRFVRSGAPEILLVNFQTHPDVIGGCRISADWPGFTRRILERALDDGTVCVLFNGAQGDSNHVNIHPDPEAERLGKYARSRRIGRALAGAVLGAHGQCRPVEAGAVRCAVREIALPLRERNAAELAAAEADWALFKSGRGKEIKGHGRLVEAARIVRIANEPDEIPFPVSAIAVGDALCFTGLPCEPFTEIGRNVKKRSPFRMTVFTCLTNGSFGYLPTAEGCTGMSYESISTIFAPAAAGVATSAQLDILRSL